MSQQLFCSIAEASQVAEARSLITSLARTLGFDETEVGKVALVITEAATNLLKHAGGGQLLTRAVESDGQPGLEILALDQGPGLSNIGQALADGYSTAGSPGTGLGAMIRLSTFFDIYSLPDKGTALLLQMWKPAKAGGFKPSGPHTGNGTLPPYEIGVVCLAKPGEEVSGDNWAVVLAGDDSLVIMVADGLGHGPIAALASLTAIQLLPGKAHLHPTALIEAAHAALLHTRGAAVAIIKLDLARQAVKAVSVGNVAGAILGPNGVRRLAAYNGTVGHQLNKFQEFSYPWSHEALLLLHSDGLGTRWNLDLYPGLASRHSGLIAGVLYRDFNRGNDDVTVMVLKQK
jgi:anti-sigma regulatory factor (Ser/Thr protein kinase)